ncbi:MAG: hypothetical protein KDB22_22540 [Planctomycetales bacterium]|nr:hypothetical protein [Planctomycetales bacterium]
MLIFAGSSPLLKRALQIAQQLSWTFVLAYVAAFGTLNVAAQTSVENQPAEDIDRIGELIRQLGNQSFHDRNAAKWELERIGLDAFDQLRDAVHLNENPEIARTAKYLLESQNVTWWLDSDSLDVRRLLEDYNSLATTEQATRFQQLMQLQSVDAAIAVARLVRYEKDDYLSKLAALELLEQVSTSEQTGHLDHLSQVSIARNEEFVPSLLLTVGDSERPAATWLRAFAEDLSLKVALGDSQPESPMQSDQWLSRVQQWQQLVQAEHEAAEKALPTEKKDRELALRFYRWLGKWITQTAGREPALATTRPCLPLIHQDVRSMQSVSLWILDAHLPELLSELSAANEQVFRNDSVLGFLLAESLQATGHLADAEELAVETSRSLTLLIEEELSGINRHLDHVEVELSRRLQLGGILASRGLFDWAEREFLTILDLAETRTKPDDYNVFQFKLTTLRMMADFYWVAGQNHLAAQTQRELVELSKSSRVNPIDARRVDLPEMTANYHFYAGLAAIDQQNKIEAIEHLLAALAVADAEPNPDVVIAMKSIANEEPFLNYYREAMDRMVSQYRKEVIELERGLTNADRSVRMHAESSLSAACNQLAWLLACCEENTEEALKLSLRSLELDPEQPSYLDTLARCYYAKRDFQNAVDTQLHVVALEPHQRQMLSQLKMFQEALENATE